MRQEKGFRGVANRPAALRASWGSVSWRSILGGGAFVWSVLSSGVAGADCIVQDSSGLIRGVMLGAGTFRVSVQLRSEALEDDQQLLHRVAGLSAVLTGRLEKTALVFDGVAEGTWKLKIVPENIAAVRITAAPEIRPAATPTESTPEG